MVAIAQRMHGYNAEMLCNNAPTSNFTPAPPRQLDTTPPIKQPTTPPSPRESWTPLPILTPLLLSTTTSHPSSPSPRVSWTPASSRPYSRASTGRSPSSHPPTSSRSSKRTPPRSTAWRTPHRWGWRCRLWRCCTTLRLRGRRSTIDSSERRTAPFWPRGSRGRRRWRRSWRWCSRRSRTTCRVRHGLHGYVTWECD